MPTYEYRCPDGHTFELFQKMSDAPPKACAVCGRKPVERLLFAPMIHFKGSGFYSTDYGRNGKKREPGAAGGEGGSEPKKADEKAAPGAKSEGKQDSGSKASDTKPSGGTQSD